MVPAADTAVQKPLPSRRSLRLRAQEAEAQQATADKGHTHVAPSAPDEASHPAAAPGTNTTNLHLIETSVPPLKRLGRPAASPTLAQRSTRLPAAWCKALGTLGTAGLALTAVLPGVTIITDDEAPAAIGQQHLLLGALSDSSLDAIGAVAAEQIDAPSGGGLLANLSDAPVQFPISGGVHLTDGFGYRTAPIAQFHNAQDFAAPEGTPVMSIADGTVTHVGYTEDGLGFNVEIEHTIAGDSVTSRYAHMQVGSAPVNVGDAVAVGERIGSVGNTGFSFGAHLHLVIEVEGEAVDPMIFIPEHSRADPLTEPASSSSAG